MKWSGELGQRRDCQPHREQLRRKVDQAVMRRDQFFEVPEDQEAVAERRPAADDGGPARAERDGGQRDLHRIDDRERIRRSAAELEQSGEQCDLEQQVRHRHCAPRRLGPGAPARALGANQRGGRDQRGQPPQRKGPARQHECGHQQDQVECNARAPQPRQPLRHRGRRRRQIPRCCLVGVCVGNHDPEGPQCSAFDPSAAGCDNLPHVRSGSRPVDSSAHDRPVVGRYARGAVMSGGVDRVRPDRRRLPVR